MRSATRLDIRQPAQCAVEVNVGGVQETEGHCQSKWA